METKEMPTHGCCHDRKHKKFLIILGLVSFAIAVVIVGALGLHERYASRSNMMGYAGENGRYGRGNSVNNITYAVPTPATEQATFVVPQDGAKSGELAITVDSIDAAKKAVADAAAKNEGSVYSSLIAYSSNDIKNGTMIVQVPIEKFDGAFADLRSVGKQVVQESTQQIEKRNVYPVMTPAVASNGPETVTTNSDKKIDAAKPVIATLPNPDQVQDKGYIKVVFADDVVSKAANYSNGTGTGSMLNNSYASQDVRKVMLIGFGIKLALLLALLFLLAYVFKKMIYHFRLGRKSNVKTNVRLSSKKSVAHVVRQAPRTRIINTKKK